MSNTGMLACLFCLVGVMWLVGSAAQDIKDKRAIEALQNGFVATCSEKQDPNILDYVERLKACRTAAELKYKMPEYLDRVR
jgi:hypothetical protein